MNPAIVSVLALRDDIWGNVYDLMSQFDVTEGIWCAIGHDLMLSQETIRNGIDTSVRLHLEDA